MACSRPQKEAEDEIPTGPNWLELPTNVTQNILQRLGVIEIVKSACLVCPLWWNICKEPSMWHTIDMRNHYTSRYVLAEIFMYAIDRSCGQVEYINIEYFGNNRLLFYIANRGSHLRGLRIAKGLRISNKLLHKVAKNLPLLEELDISVSKLSGSTLEVIARCCPLMKSFKFISSSYFPGGEEAFPISKMSRLCHLKLSGSWLRDDGLLAILEGCPHLESLDIQECSNAYLSEWLVKRCHEQIKDFHPPSNNYQLDTSDSDGDSDNDNGCAMACSRPQMEAEDEIPTGPNWLELPRDVTQNILQRLGVIEIVKSACLVCPLWWNICKEPSMWHTIDMRNHYTSRYILAEIFMYAIDRSCGQVEYINIEYFGNNQLLLYIANRGSHLRGLRIAKGLRISNKLLKKVAKNLPLLEELDIPVCKLSGGTLEVIARCCPLMKSFKFMSSSYFPGGEGAFPISKMSRLCHLKLSGSRLSNVGLLAILEGCPHLESLDIQECFNVNLSEWLVKRCHEQIKDFHPPSNNYLEDDSDSDYDNDYYYY